MKYERIELIPRAWPARLDVVLASLYLGVSERTLWEGADTGRYPAPVADGKRMFWSRDQLDLFVRDQFGIQLSVDQQPPEGAKPRGWGRSK